MNEYARLCVFEEFFYDMTDIFDAYAYEGTSAYYVMAEIGNRIDHARCALCENSDTTGLTCAETTRLPAGEAKPDRSTD